MASRKRTDFSLNIGTSSILFIFVVLCLVSFSILSLASALSDNKLSNKVLDYTESYATACNEAYERLSSFDDSLKTVYESGISRSGYFESVGKKFSFAISFTDIQTLDVEIKILYPENPGEPFYEITKWSTSTVGDLEFDDSLPVFK